VEKKFFVRKKKLNKRVQTILKRLKKRRNASPKRSSPSRRGSVSERMGQFDATGTVGD
jgi:hypothetical protein